MAQLFEERAKRRKAVLPGSLYVEKMLMDTAVTGAAAVVPAMKVGWLIVG